MSSEVKLFDKNTGSLLFSTTIENSELAYKKAEEYEDMGIEVEMKSPSIPETLIRSLGANEQNVEKLNRVIEEEIESHIDEEAGCSICLPKQ